LRENTLRVFVTLWFIIYLTTKTRRHKGEEFFFFLGEKGSQTEDGVAVGAGVLVGLPLPEHQGLLEQRAWGTQVSPQ
jgi:hypothetical protein